MEREKAWLVVAIGSAAMLGGACGGGAPPPSTPQATSTSPSPSSPPAASPGRRVVYTSDTDQDLWIVDVDSRKRRRLTADGDRRVEAGAQFAGLAKVSYSVRDSIELLDLATGSRRVLVPDASEDPRVTHIPSHDWNADGSRLAYLTIVGHTPKEDSSLLDVVVTDGAGAELARTRLPITIPEGLGGACLNRDKVSFARDGSFVAVELYAGVGGVNAVFVRTQGGVIGKPMHLTDIAPTVEESVTAKDDSGWIRFRPASGSRATLPIAKDARRVALSGDGGRAAVETNVRDGSDFGRGSLKIVDLETRHERAFATDAARPVWIDDERILVTTGQNAVCADFASELAVASGAGVARLGTGPTASFDLSPS